MSSLFAELKRRNVFRVGFAYLVVTWLLLQVADVMIDNIGAPDWVFQALLIVLGAGFVVIMIFSWVFELTPEGLKRDHEVDHSRSITHDTGRKLDRAIIIVLLVSVAYFIWESRYSDQRAAVPAEDSASTDESVQASAANSDAERLDPSIAVLPFADLSSQGDQEYFADGLSEEILNVLVGVEHLTVASRTSSFQFKNDELGLPDIAAKLGVTYVLEGSVRKAGETIRVTGQLIEAGTDRHLWSDTFDRELTTENLFSIQDEIAKAIVEALRVELDIPEDGLVVDTVGVSTENLSAYDTFLKGRKIFHGRRQLSDIADSISLFEKATDEDPQFALGWQWLGAAYSVASGWGLHNTLPRDYPTLATQAAERALELDSSLAFAHGVRGIAAIINPGGDYLFAMEQLERGLELEPNNVTLTHWYGILLRELGFVGDSMTYFDKCEALDPAFGNCVVHRARTLMFQGNYEEALEEWSRFPGEFAPLGELQVVDGFSIAKVGQSYAARVILSKSFENQPDFPARSWIAIIQGKKDRNSVEGAAVERWLDATARENALTLFAQGSDLLIFLNLSIGAYEKVDTNSISPGPGNVNGIWMKDFVGFRNTPQFKEIVRNMNFLPYWQAKGFPPGCRAVGDDDFECGY